MSLLVPHPAALAGDLEKAGCVATEYPDPGIPHMDGHVYTKLNAIQDQLAGGRYGDAFAELDALTEKRLDPYEQAQVDHTYGYAHALQSDFEKAALYWERTLNADVLNGAARQQLLKSLASIYAGMGEHQKAVDRLSEWFCYEVNPAPEAYEVMAASLASLGRPEAALPWAVEANARSSEPVEVRYQLELSLYLDTGRHAEAVRILEFMIDTWPENPEHKKQLQTVRSKLNDNE